MGQVCSTPGAVQASTPRNVGAKPQDTPQQGQAPPEPVAVSTSTVSSAGALSSCCCEHEVEHKAERRSTGEKKVSITKEVCTSSGCGATGITAIKDTVQDAPHEDTPREDPAAAALKPYADDSALLSPVLEETLNTDSPAKTAPEYPTAGHHHNHHHVSIAEPAPASQPTSMAGSSAEAHSSAGHPAAHSNYSIASNMSASEHSFLTDTAVGDAADLADEVSESVMKAAPSAAVSRMATKTYNESDSGARRSADSCDEHQQTSLDHSTLKEHERTAHEDSTHSLAGPASKHGANKHSPEQPPVENSIEALDDDKEPGCITDHDAPAADSPTAEAQREVTGAAEEEHSHGAKAADSVLDALVGELSSSEKEGVETAAVSSEKSGDVACDAGGVAEA